ncbi:MAG: hypothetical protein J6M60_01325 [Clostridia bacterium]|nr:hypothetical protein [Clostridia bacterium]
MITDVDKEVIKVYNMIKLQIKSIGKVLLVKSKSKKRWIMMKNKSRKLFYVIILISFILATIFLFTTKSGST